MFGTRPDSRIAVIKALKNGTETYRLEKAPGPICSGLSGRIRVCEYSSCAELLFQLMDVVLGKAFRYPTLCTQLCVYNLWSLENLRVMSVSGHGVMGGNHSLLKPEPQNMHVMLFREDNRPVFKGKKSKTSISLLVSSPNNTTALFPIFQTQMERRG